MMRFLPVWLLIGATVAFPASMEDSIRRAISGFQGTVSLYARNIETGASFGIREDEKVRTASTIKLPILVAVFSAVEAGKASWTERLPLEDADKVYGSGVMREFSGGQRFLLRDLANLMIVVSDNTATNLILDRFSADFVNAEMDKLGLKATRSMRKVLGDGKNVKPVASGFSKAGLLEENRRFGIGSSTPKEMVLLLEQIAQGKLISAEASRQMLAILKRQQYKDGIGRRLEGSLVASKSGSLDALRSDVGLVFGKGGTVALAITVDGMPKVDYSADNVGNKLIADLTGYLVEGLRGQ